MKTSFFVLIVALSPCAHAEYYPLPEARIFGQPDSKRQEEAVDALMSRFRDAWADEDASGVAATHSTDAEWTNAFGRIFRGAEELEEFLGSRLFPEFDAAIAKAEMESYKELSRRYLGSDVVVIQASIQSDRGSSIGAGSRRAYLNFILSERDGEWKIVHQVITDVRERRSSD